MATYISAVPAYGRDYTEEEDVLADWATGKDFRIQDLRHSGYVNKDDLPVGFVLEIRYDKTREIVLVDKKGKMPEDPPEDLEQQ